MNVFLELIYSFAPSTDGFLFMWGILLLVFVFVYLYIKEIFLFRKMGDVHPEKFLLKMRQLTGDKNYEEALKICESAGDRALPKIARAALSRGDLSPEMIRSSVEEEVVVHSSKIDRNISYFATIGNISTLLGLMGTIYGLVLAFAAVGKPDVLAIEKTAMLANGISTAMNTTLFGLTVAVPCLLAYSYFYNRGQKNIVYFDRQASSILNSVYGDNVKLKNYKPSERRRHREIDTELDLTPIMGLMVVLIPLLLSSAEFVKIGIIEMSLPKSGKGSAAQTSEQDEKPQKLDLGLIVTEKGIWVKSTLGGASSEETEEGEAPIKKTGDKYDLEKLTSELSKIKKQVLIQILSANMDSTQLAEQSLFQLSKWMESVDSENMFHYKDYDNIKIAAKNKTGFQTIINVMDATRNTEEDGRTIPLFPNVSLGAGI